MRTQRSLYPKRGIELAFGLMTWVGVIGLVAFYMLGFRLLSVQTPSMQPALAVGDLVVARFVNSPLKVGDVISYRSNMHEGETVTHRVASIDEARKIIITKGDNLEQADPPIRPSQVLGRQVLSVPGLGRFLQAFKRPVVLAVGIFLPALAIIISEIALLVRHQQTQGRYHAERR